MVPQTRWGPAPSADKGRYVGRQIWRSAGANRILCKFGFRLRLGGCPRAPQRLARGESTRRLNHVNWRKVPSGRKTWDLGPRVPQEQTTKSAGSEEPLLRNQRLVFPNSCLEPYSRVCFRSRQDKRRRVLMRRLARLEPSAAYDPATVIALYYSWHLVDSGPIAPRWPSIF